MGYLLAFPGLRVREDQIIFAPFLGGIFFENRTDFWREGTRDCVERKKEWRIHIAIV
jgi:hypothetical protein